jgi:hypothetical protein
MVHWAAYIEIVSFVQSWDRIGDPSSRSFVKDTGRAVIYVAIEYLSNRIYSSSFSVRIPETGRHFRCGINSNAIKAKFVDDVFYPADQSSVYKQVTLVKIWLQR